MGVRIPDLSGNTLVPPIRRRRKRGGRLEPSIPGRQRRPKKLPKNLGEALVNAVEKVIEDITKRFAREGLKKDVEEKREAP